jgi:putative glutamine amidotransferase
MKLSSALYEGHYPFEKMGLFTNFNTVTFPEELEKGSALVVWGGGDISPSLYGRSCSDMTGAGSIPSRRDVLEWDLMKAALALDIPIIGICRGAQMLCALAGGFLIQDVTNHGNSHDVVTKEGDVFKASSLHHQMMYPFDVEHELLVTSKRKLSDHYLDVNEDVAVPFEPEFVYFPKVRGIAVQWHPEFMDYPNPSSLYVKEKVRLYCYG